MIFSQRVNLLQEIADLVVPKIKRGIEKESLRIDANGRLSQRPHPRRLGSALTHPFITTDYSEALIELVTPTFFSCEEVLAHLEELHKIVYHCIDDELLWVNSLPCLLGTDSSIPIAEFGSSNIGQMKRIYRKGLALRYSRKMQIIAGIHYNFSVPHRFWQIFNISGKDPDFKHQVSNGYMAGIRNFHRYCWLLFYLFGASPAACRSFFSDAPGNELSSMNSHTVFAPYGTSLRMSNYGYRNPVQSEIVIDHNSVQGYIQTLEKTINTPYPAYENFGVKIDGKYVQLNANLLQIENEYYSVIRPKRRIFPLEKPSIALQKRGVEYLEVRCLDLDPFEPTGISLSEAKFIDLFLMYCLLYPSPLFNDDCPESITRNKDAIVLQGRKPNLMLQKGCDQIELTKWAMEILDDVRQIAEIFDEVIGGDLYQRCVTDQKSKLLDSDLTPSGQVLSALKQNKEPFFNFAMNLTEKTKQTFIANSIADSDIQHYNNIAVESIENQRAIEAADELELDQFLADYFSQ